MSFLCVTHNALANLTAPPHFQQTAGVSRGQVKPIVGLNYFILLLFAKGIKQLMPRADNNNDGGRGTAVASRFKDTLVIVNDDGSTI